MQNQRSIKFSLSISRREMLTNTLQALQGQLNWIENHLTAKNAQALELKNKIELYEKKIAKALIRQAELETLAKKPKGLSAKHQQELENCKKNN